MAEELICGETMQQGGEFEWVCTKPPHDSKELPMGHNMKPVTAANHAFQPFRIKVAQKTCT